MADAVLAPLCPRCQAPNPAPPDAAQAPVIIDCVSCNRSFALPQGEEGGRVTAAPELDASAESHGSTDRATASTVAAAGNLAPTEVGLARSALLAAGATAIFYAVAVAPLQGSYFAALFANRGWVPYVIALMASWSAVILVLKLRLLREQERDLGRDLLPKALGECIDRDNAQEFAAHLDACERPAAGSFLAERLVKALRTYRSRESVSDVVEQLNLQALNDAEQVDASYTLVRTFIWAIPILGFIGTVIGIGTAVSGFSSSVASAADLELMKQSIGSVTTGLGVAFDTTLLALVVSILVMFPSSALQKAERNFLSRVEEYCSEHLVRRLAQPSAVPSPEALPGELGRLQTELQRLTRTLEALNDRFDGAESH